MACDIESLMPSGLNVGIGVSYRNTPFKNIVEIDYYDGVIEGFAEIDSIEMLVYFKKIWWDDFQNLRLFIAYIVLKSEFDIDILKNCDNIDYDVIKSKIDNISQKPHSFYFFSKNINAEVFCFLSNSD